MLTLSRDGVDFDFLTGRCAETRAGVGEGATVASATDSLGNLTTQAGQPQAFDYPQRPHAVQRRGPAGSETTYDYDADGNVRAIVGPGTARYFQFDSGGRLVCMGNGEGPYGGLCNQHVFYYDVHGRRLADVVANLVYTVYAGDAYVFWRVNLAMGDTTEISAFGERIASRRGNGNRRQASAWGGFAPPPGALGGAAALAMLGLLLWAARRGDCALLLEQPARASIALAAAVTLAIPPGVSWAGGGGGGPVYYWELSDPLGTGMLQVDANGARVRHSVFKPFGELYAQVGVDADRKRWAGHPRHDDTGLYYMQARWMDPGSGTFLSVDPLVGDAFDPQAVNAYSYARNNPVSYTDPTGMAFGEVTGATAAIFGTTVASYQIGLQFQTGQWDAGAIVRGFVNGFVAGAVIGVIVETGGAALPAVSVNLGEGALALPAAWSWALGLLTGSGLGFLVGKSEGDAENRENEDKENEQSENEKSPADTDPNATPASTPAPNSVEGASGIPSASSSSDPFFFPGYDSTPPPAEGRVTYECLTPIC